MTFEGSPLGEPAWFTQLGINIEGVWPGQPNGYYQCEESQADFLVYPVSELALCHGAGVTEMWTSGAFAYMPGRPRRSPARIPTGCSPTSEPPGAGRRARWQSPIPGSGCSSSRCRSAR